MKRRVCVRVSRAPCRIGWSPVQSVAPLGTHVALAVEALG